MVRAGRDDNAPGNLERRHEPLPGGVDIELEAVPVPESPVHWREKHAIALPPTGKIGGTKGWI